MAGAATGDDCDLGLVNGRSHDHIVAIELLKTRLAGDEAFEALWHDILRVVNQLSKGHWSQRSTCASGLATRTGSIVALFSVAARREAGEMLIFHSHQSSPEITDEIAWNSKPTPLRFCLRPPIPGYTVFLSRALCQVLPSCLRSQPTGLRLPAARLAVGLLSARSLTCITWCLPVGLLPTQRLFARLAAEGGSDCTRSGKRVNRM